MKTRRTQIHITDVDQIRTSGGLTVNDLIPSGVFVEIVLRLSTKSIIMCNCVCKAWRSLISDPHFAELHLARAKTCVLIRNSHYSKFSRSLYLLEPEDLSLDSGYCRCRDGKKWCKNCRYNRAVTTKVKIPLRNVQFMLDKVEYDDDIDAMFCVATSCSKKLTKLESSHEHKYVVVNSCNGLLCLSISNMLYIRLDTHPAVVCNPVTGEFIHLPEEHNGVHFDNFGLGFSPKHNQYKVIRISTQQGRKYSYVGVAEIHTLGTDSWRNLDISGFELPSLINSDRYYLDGALYWILKDDSMNYHVSSFDFDEEQFHLNSFPSFPQYLGNLSRLALRVLGGRLYLYTDLVDTHVVIWVMNGHGVSKSWAKLLSVEASELHVSSGIWRYELICCLDNEAIVMFGGPWHEFIYYDKLQGLKFKRVKFQCPISSYEVISHTPSFISLKDIVKHCNVEVLNINSRCGKLKLLEETYHHLSLRGARK